MAYKISGVKSETARVMILKESDWSIESNTVISGSGAYEVGDLAAGTKTTLAQTEGDETIGFGNVSPIFALLSSVATPEVFNSARTAYISSAMLDSTHVMISYRDYGNSYYGTSIVGTISGTSIIWGDDNVFNSGATTDISSVMLDSTHVMVSYKDAGNSNYGTSIVGTISNGDEIAWGSESLFNSATTEFISSAMIDSTHVMVSYRDAGNSYSGTSIVGTISGTSITWGSESVFNSGQTDYISLVMLDPTQALVSYTDTGNSYRGTSIVGTINGDVITFPGSESVFNDSGITSYISSVLLDSTHVLVSYRDVGNSGYGTSIVGTIDGTSITFPGSESVFNSGDSLFISSVMLDSTHVSVSYADKDNSYSGTSIVGTIDGTTITFGSENVFNSENTNDYISSVALDSTHVMISYRDYGNSYYGTSVVLY